MAHCKSALPLPMRKELGRGGNGVVHLAPHYKGSRFIARCVVLYRAPSPRSFP